MFFNARSLSNNFKLHELIEISNEKNLHIIGIVETWLHSNIDNGEINIPGFTIYRKDRDGQRGGGIILYIKNNLISRLYDVNIEILCEGIVCEIGNVNNDGILMAVIYKAPNASEEEVNNMYQIIKNITNKHALIMGDFNFPNINWHEHSCDNNSEKFLELIEDCFLHQHVTEPTRGNNILDLIFTTEEGMVSNLTIESPINSSDHSTISFNLTCATSNHLLEDNNINNYNYNIANFQYIKTEIEKIEWDRSFENKSVEEMWNIFLKFIKQIIEENIPKYKKKIQNK